MRTTRNNDRNIYQIGRDAMAIRQEAKEAGTHAGYKLCVEILGPSQDRLVRSLLEILQERTRTYDRPSAQLLLSLKEQEVASTYNRAFLLAVVSVADILPASGMDMPVENLRSLASNMEKEDITITIPEPNWN